MTTITVTYHLKLDGDPATCALVARHLLDYLVESSADVQDTLLECGHPPYDDNYDEHDDQISFAQELFEAWNSNTWKLTVMSRGIGLHADQSRRAGDAIAAAAEIDAYIIRNVRDRWITPSAKMSILRVATPNGIYQTLLDYHLVGDLTASDIAAGHRLLLDLLSNDISIDYLEVQP